MRADMRRGSLTVEAAVVLPLVFMIIFSILMVSKVYSTYSMIDQAITKASYDVSNGGYILRDTGILGFVESLTAVDEEFTDGFNSLKEATETYFADAEGATEIFEDFKTNVEILKTAQSVTEIIEVINALKGNVEKTYGIVMDGFNLAKQYLVFFTNPDLFIDTAGAISSEFFDEVKNYIGVLYVTKAVKDYFEDLSVTDADSLAEKLYLDGPISYNESEFYTTAEIIFGDKIKPSMIGKKNISKITATYSMNLRLPIDLGLDFLDIRNTVIMRGFTGET